MENHSARARNSDTSAHPIICFSHLRWDFVLQRPQHLMGQFARSHDVVFWEEPASIEQGDAGLAVRTCGRTGVIIVTPQLPASLSGDQQIVALRALLTEFASGRADSWIRWYYTPLMLAFSSIMRTALVVYDCMDELSAFSGASPNIPTAEAQLFMQADVVFTGGHALFESKRKHHANVHAFPSSIDVDHFKNAPQPTPDQDHLPHPRAGFFGVIDERMDLELLTTLADSRPGLSIVMIGPLAKLSESQLPRRANIHYLGPKHYDQLPSYLAGWDVALMPFAINDATRFISPTKTPEYLAGGKPVVSTPIKDVVRSYGHLDSVKIAATAEAFAQACDAALALSQESGWRAQVDATLSAGSWSSVARDMQGLMDAALSKPKIRRLPIKRPHYDVLVVGAGFAGSVIAERYASQTRKRVMLIDRRDHIGGNAYDRVDANGILMHQYGPHIFHTNSEKVFDYLSQFTEWRQYEHRVLSHINGLDVPIPINRTTLNRIYKINLRDDAEAARFLAARAEPVKTIKTSEDVVVSAVGRDLYEKFFRGYTRKQWGMDPSELDKSVTARVPTRTNVDDRYFTDTYQAMPRDGYTAMFKRMLDHDAIDLHLATEWASIAAKISYDRLVFTGPIDAYFDHCYGKLPYRSLRFEHKTLDQKQFQSVGTVNYPDEDVPYTRVTEYKHLTGQRHPQTTVTYEYPCADGDPFYPIPRPENAALYEKYERLARQEETVSFVGRLASYRYYNMDQVVAQALTTFQRLEGGQVGEGSRHASSPAA